MEEDKEAAGQRLEGGVPPRVLNVLMRWATWRNVLILWAGLVAFNLLVIGPAYRRIGSLSGGVGAIDSLIVYRPEKVYDMIAAYGEQGRGYYATIALMLDTAFPLLSALTFGLTLALLFSRTFSRRDVLHRALFVPVGAMAADLLENAGIATMLLSYPKRLPAVALLTSSFSTVKWTAVATESLLVVIGLIAWVVNVLRGKGSDGGDGGVDAVTPGGG
jgi:hypothetical protein